MNNALLEFVKKNQLIVWMVLIAAAILILNSSKNLPNKNQELPPQNNDNNKDLLSGTRNAIVDATKPTAPEIIGISNWINSKPLSLESLRGKVVLVDFWTYSCINCQRTIPFLNGWDEKYGKDGLVIIGVHTPEFEFEKKLENVKAAVIKASVKYPVAMDNDYLTWKAYKNNYWPRKYLIDAQGRIRYDHIGEGGYEETEMMIQKLLLERIDSLKFNGTAFSQIKELTPANRGQSPETYAGYGFARAELGNVEGFKPDEIVNYAYPKSVPIEAITLEGKWKNNYGNLEHVGNGSGKIGYKFKASKVFLVTEGKSSATILLNGKYLDNWNKGEDVQIDMEGKSTVEFLEPRMYRLIGGNLEFGENLLELETSGDGFAIYAFTFG
ncbi:thioredoxin family protein [Candidatus Micrarchaeota archaeon]|nr:thioredoxin family protein [Candidatus Micrarchaeota archaeon]